MADGDTSVPAAPGNTNTTALATGTFTAVSIQTLTFVGHHGLMNDNDQDWTGSGLPMPDPTFQAGNTRAQPVSITAGSPLSVQLTVLVSPPDAPALPCEIVAAPTGWTQTWHATGVTLQGGSNSVKLDSGETTGTSVREVDGDLVFTFNNGKDPTFTAKVPAVQIFLTAGTPVDRNNTWEQGLTVRHMKRAVARVAATGADDAHGIVAGLMKLVPKYTLVADPRVPPKFKHPSYLDNGLGGAWPLDDYLQYGAQCQAICRMVMAMFTQVGVGIPGTAELRVIWADPDDDPKGKPKDDPFAPVAGLDKTREVNGEHQWAALTDAHVEVGKRYDDGNTDAANYVGLNKYECCVRVEVQQIIRYYGGGVAGFSTGPGQIIQVFNDLAWFARVDDDTIVCREVVWSWRDAAGQVIRRDAAGNVIPGGQ